MGTHNRTLSGGLAVALAATMLACGGGSDDTGSPTPPSGGGGGGGTGTVAATITITAAGASPRSVTIPAGSRVTFVNNDSRAHDVASDPHPVHTDCTDINQVGFLTVGQSRTTGNLNTRRVCGFHDHNLPDDASLQGTITVQ
jgi:plastocyanin